MISQNDYDLISTFKVYDVPPPDCSNRLQNIIAHEDNQLFDQLSLFKDAEMPAFFSEELFLASRSTSPSTVGSNTSPRTSSQDVFPDEATIDTDFLAQDGIHQGILSVASYTGSSHSECFQQDAFLAQTTFHYIDSEFTIPESAVPSISDSQPSCPSIKRSSNGVKKREAFRQNYKKESEKIVTKNMPKNLMRAMCKFADNRPEFANHPGFTEFKQEIQDMALRAPKIDSLRYAFIGKNKKGRDTGFRELARQFMKRKNFIPFVYGKDNRMKDKESLVFMHSRLQKAVEDPENFYNFKKQDPSQKTYIEFIF